MISIDGNFQISPLRKCGISVAHMSMPDRANGLKREDGDGSGEEFGAF